MTEELKAMEARAVAAERALADLKAYADDTFKLWDNDQDSKVGKRLMWMSGTSNRDYEPNLKHIHEISTTAARQMIRKADEAATYAQMLGLLSTVAPCFECAGPLDMAWAQRLADTLRRQLAEAEALVERMKTGFRQTLENCAIAQFGSGYYEEMNLLLALTPAAALAEYRRDVLEEVAKLYEIDGYQNLAAEIRAMKEGGK